jgi:tRNA(fMet)-specific endonuclease VapC
VGLILDTSELIAVERQGGTIRDVLLHFDFAERLSLTAMSLAELKHGVRRADSPQRAAIRQRFLDDAICALIIIPIGPTIAMRAGDLEAELELRGEKLATADLLIAATALVANLPLATHNVRHFDRVRDLQLVTR